MNLELLKLCEFYTHPDDEFDTIGPLDVTTIWTEGTRSIFVVTYWIETFGHARSMVKNTYTTYSDAISACLHRTGWGTWEDLVADELGETR